MTQLRETAKACPKCGPATRLVIQTNSLTNAKFLGCSEYPKCKYTEQLPADIEMKSTGALPMPGL